MIITAAMLGLCLSEGLRQNAQAELNWEEIKSQFGDSRLFGYNKSDIAASANGQHILTSAGINTEAYTNTPGANAFYTFCFSPTEGTSDSMRGTLNYDPVSGTTTRLDSTDRFNMDGDLALRNGAAWLYAKFASGDIDLGTLNSGNWKTFQDAIHLLAKQATTASKVSSSNNRYIQQMLSESGLTASQAVEAYRVGDQNVTKDYAVFVINMVNSTTNNNLQDMLYVVKCTGDDNSDDNSNNTGEVPEPASILFWTLGSVGAASASWLRKRKTKLLA